MNLPGRPNIVCFRDMASYSLYEQKKKTGETKESIVTAAPKLIKAELRDLDKLNKVYPTFDQLSNIKDQKQWVPESLQLLLSYLIPFDLKQVIIVILCCFFFFLIQIIKNNNLKSHKLQSQTVVTVRMTDKKLCCHHDCQYLDVTTFTNFDSF